MAENDQADALVRAYSRLVSLRDVLNGLTVGHVAQSYIDEFHGALDRLKGVGVDVEEFRVTPAAIQRPGSSSYMGGAAAFRATRGDPYVDRALLLSKLGAVIGYFEMSTSEPKRPIGFRA